MLGRTRQRVNCRSWRECGTNNLQDYVRLTRGTGALRGAAGPWLPAAGECDEIAIPMKPAAKPGTETEARAALLRQIPSVDELLALPRLKTLAGRGDRALVVEKARAVLADRRAPITGERGIKAVAVHSAQLGGWVA